MIQKIMKSVNQVYNNIVHGTIYLALDYVYQMTVDRAPESACGVSSLSILTGIDVNVIDKYFKKKNPRLLYRQDQTNHLAYLRMKGYRLKQLTAERKYYTPTDDDFQKMRYELLQGRPILYHLPKHYLVCVGVNSDSDFIFHDPAGDKRKGYFKDQFAGNGVIYTRDNLKKWKIKYTIYSVRND